MSRLLGADIPGCQEILQPASDRGADPQGLARDGRGLRRSHGHPWSYFLLHRHFHGLALRTYFPFFKCPRVFGTHQRSLCRSSWVSHWGRPSCPSRCASPGARRTSGVRFVEQSSASARVSLRGLSRPPPSTAASSPSPYVYVAFPPIVRLLIPVIDNRRRPGDARG